MKDSDNGYTTDVIGASRFIDRKKTSPDDAFAHLQNIKRNEKNKFLFEDMTGEERKRQGRVLIKRIDNGIL